MAGVWKPAKTRCRFPPVSTPPWESGKRRRIPTFPPRRRRLSSTKHKIKKTKGSRPLRGLQIRIYFRITLHWKRYRVSGSSEDWKMLRRLNDLDSALLVAVEGPENRVIATHLFVSCMCVVRPHAYHSRGTGGLQ